MSTYHPDSWVPVLIRSEKHGPIYKILCSWYGGFAGSDYWKLSSGIESITINTDPDDPTNPGTLTIPQSSGSVYVVSGRTHMSSLMGAMLAHWSQRADESEGDDKFTIEVVKLEDLLDVFCST